MSSIHTVGEKRISKNRKPKLRSLETLGDYSLYREDGLFRVTLGARFVGYRSTQQAAHKLVKSDIRHQKVMAQREGQKAAA